MTEQGAPLLEGIGCLGDARILLLPSPAFNHSVDCVREQGMTCSVN